MTQVTAGSLLKGFFDFTTEKCPRSCRCSRLISAPLTIVNNCGSGRLPSFKLQISEIPDVLMTDLPDPSGRWQQYLADVPTSFASLVNVDLKVANLKFPVHRNLLCAQSEDSAACLPPVPAQLRAAGQLSHYPRTALKMRSPFWRRYASKSGAKAQ